MRIASPSRGLLAWRRRNPRRSARAMMAASRGSPARPPWPERAWSEWPWVIERPGNGPDRIDVEAAERAVQALGGLGEDVGGTQAHGGEIGRSCAAVRPGRVRSTAREEALRLRHAGDRIGRVERGGEDDTFWGSSCRSSSAAGSPCRPSSTPIMPSRSTGPARIPSSTGRPGRARCSSPPGGAGRWSTSCAGRRSPASPACCAGSRRSIS